MARIRSIGTAPELAVRRAAHAMGLRYRLNRRDLPGTPDLVFPRFRVALFVHRCFWHRSAAARVRGPTSPSIGPGSWPSPSRAHCSARISALC